ncbi:hypothetical protein, partial [Marinobacter sp.]|uniref:hypothetical protein n=1 Tax=Marinobacter sp. TaxID=50741 RepID=UPI003A94B25C
ALLIVCQVLDGALLTRLRGVKPGIGDAANVRFCLEAGLDCRRFGIFRLFRASRIRISDHILCPTMRVSENGRLLDVLANGSKYRFLACLMINNHVQQSMIQKGTFYDHRLCAC